MTADDVKFAAWLEEEAAIAKTSVEVMTIWALWKCGVIDEAERDRRGTESVTRTMGEVLAIRAHAYFATNPATRATVRATLVAVPICGPCHEQLSRPRGATVH